MKFHRYKLKDEYRQLFKTLSSSDEYLPMKECFADRNKPHRKSYADVRQAEKHDVIMKKLEGADFLDIEEQEIDVVEKS